MNKYVAIDAVMTPSIVFRIADLVASTAAA